MIEHSQRLKLCNLENDLILLQRCLLSPSHTLGLNKLMVCGHESLYNHGQWLVKRLLLHPLLGSWELCFCSLPLCSRVSGISWKVSLDLTFVLFLAERSDTVHVIDRLLIFVPFFAKLYAISLTTPSYWDGIHQHFVYFWTSLTV